MSMQNQLQKLAEAAAAHESSAAVGRLKRLFDEGTFVELDRFSCDEAAIGYGTVDGSPVYAFAQNCEVCCGAVGKAQAAKIRQVYALAEQNGAPVVGLFDSDGAKLGEGLDAMDALAEILLISNRISGVVPQIAVVAGACVGSAALVAANADITVAVDGADYYLKPDEKGSAAVAAADVDEAIDKVRGLLALLPSNNLTVAPAYDFDDAAMAEAADAAAAVEAVADAGSSVRLFAGECGTAVLGRVGGIACGIVALTGDAVCGGAAAQIARFVRLCDAFSLPVISFVDAAGFADLGGAAKLAHTGVYCRCRQIGRCGCGAGLAGCGDFAAEPGGRCAYRMERAPGPDEESRAGPCGADRGICQNHVFAAVGGGRRICDRCGRTRRNQGAGDGAAGYAFRQACVPSAQEAFQPAAVSRGVSGSLSKSDFWIKCGGIQHETIQYHGQRQSV